MPEQLRRYAATPSESARFLGAEPNFPSWPPAGYTEVPTSVFGANDVPFEAAYKVSDGGYVLVLRTSQPNLLYVPRPAVEALRTWVEAHVGARSGELVGKAAMALWNAVLKVRLGTIRPIGFSLANTLDIPMPFGAQAVAVSPLGVAAILYFVGRPLLVNTVRMRFREMVDSGSWRRGPSFRLGIASPGDSIRVGTIEPNIPSAVPAKDVRESLHPVYREMYDKWMALPSEARDLFRGLAARYDWFITYGGTEAEGRARLFAAFRKAAGPEQSDSDVETVVDEIVRYATVMGRLDAARE